MKKQINIGRKVISLTLAFCMSAPAAVPASIITGSPETSASFLAELPKSIGKIDQVSEPLSSPYYFLNIQDAHTNPSAQENIKNILHWAASNHKGKVVIGVEGAKGAMHPEYLNFFPANPALNHAIVRKLAEQGELNGAELFALENMGDKKSKTLIQGVENTYLYRKNLLTYREILNNLSEIDIQLTSLKNLFETLRNQLFSKELNHFIEERNRRKEGDYSKKNQAPQLDVYLKFIRAEAQRLLSINLDESIEQLRYPQLFSLLSLERLAAGHSPQEAEEQRQACTAVLLAAAKTNVDRELVNEFSKIEISAAPRILTEKIWTFAKSKNIDLQKYPAWLQRVGAGILQSELSIPELFNEFSQIEDLLTDKMLHTQKARDLFTIFRQLDLTEKFIRAEVSRAELSLIKNQNYIRPSALLTSARKLGAPKDPKTSRAAAKLDAHFRTADYFYQLAEKRDRVLFQNALIAARNLTSSPESRPTLIILVTGGFHTPGLISLARALGMPFSVIQPAIKSLPSSEQMAKVYRDENVNPIQSFAGPLTKQQVIFLNQILESGGDYLKEVSKMSAPDVTAELIRAINNHPALNGSIAALPEGETQAIASGAKKSHIQTSLTTTAIAETALLSNVRAYGRFREAQPWSSQLRDKKSPAPKPGSFSPNFNIVKRSEVRISSRDFSALVKLMVAQIAPLKGRDRINALSRSLASLVTAAGTPKETVIDGLQNELNKLKDDHLIEAIKDLLRHAQGKKVAVTSFDGTGRSTALMLTEMGHDVTVVDSRDQIKVVTPEKDPFFSRFNQEDNFSLIDRLGIESAEQVRGNPDKTKEREDAFFKVVSENDIIFLDSGYEIGSDYKLYREHLLGQAMDFGNALKKLRQEEARLGKPHTSKVFIVRATVDVETTEKVYDTIKWHMQSNDPEKIGLDVVYQPDFINYDSNSLREPYVMFGIRSAPGTRQHQQTEAMIRSLYANNTAGARIDFVDLRSAVQAKDDLIIYLATKLAFFNDLAELSDRFGADLSIVAKGAGLDRRIQTLFSNPSLAFGGRLLVLLNWIESQRLNRLEGKNIGSRKITSSEIDQLLKLKLQEIQNGKLTMESAIDSLPKEFRLLFWIKLIRSINENNERQFLESKIQSYFKTDSLRGKKVALLGVGYSRKSGRIIESPALDLIERLVVDKHVNEFYIIDPQARQDFKEWLDEQRTQSDRYQSVIFHGIDKGEVTDLYEAVAKSDLSIIATDSNPDIFHLDLEKLKISLRDTPLFDGINLFGIRANGELANGMSNYKLDSIRSSGINYVSVGRPSIGPSAQSRQGPILSDSKIYTTLGDYPEKSFDRLQITAIGGGYVGLTTAANLSTLGPEDKPTAGHHVHVVDILKAKPRIDGLNSAETIVPIYEPGLQQLIVEGKKQGTIDFSVDKHTPIKESIVTILAVGTPQKDDGEIDLSQILNSASEIGAIINELKAKKLPALADGIPGHFKIMTIKSTVTPDTFERIVDRLALLGLEPGIDYALSSMPEFLKEGTAVNDVRYPDRTVIGIYADMPQNAKDFTEKALLKLTYPLMKLQPHPVIITDTSTSTLIKYAANSLLAVSISLSNIFAQEAELAEADYFAIREALAADERISKFAFLFPGCGYGGSCFPKDVRALNTLSIAEVSTIGLRLIQAADTLNGYFQDEVVDKVIRGLTRYPEAQSPIRGKSIALWGLAFKPQTDDVRETPSARIVARLIQKGASHITLHDPIFNVQPHLREHVENRFLEELEKNFTKMKLFTVADGDFKSWIKQNFLSSGRIRFTSTKEEALTVTGATGEPTAVETLILTTDWPQYKDVDFSQLSPKGKPLFLLDARNLWRDLKSRENIAAAGNITYQGIGTLRILPTNNDAARSEIRLNFRTKTTSELLAFISAAVALKIDFKHLEPLREVSALVAGNYYGNLLSHFSNVEEAHYFAQLSWGQNAASATHSQNKIMELAQEILGEDYFNLLFKLSGAPIHIISVAEKNMISDGALLFLAAAGRNDSATYVIHGSKQEALKIEQEFEAKAISLGLPPTIRSNFSVIASAAPSADVTTMKREAGSDLQRKIGFVNPQLIFLERIGYIPNTYRFFTEGIAGDSILSFTALLLKNQLPDSISIKNLRQELEARNLSVDVLAERMGRLIAAIRHIATQA